MNIPKIIFEHTDYLVINKPAGLIVHSDGRTDEPTVVDWLLEHYPDIANVGEHWYPDEDTVIPRPGIVHRLDRDTSGVMVIARTAEMFDHLKQQFKNYTVEKEYHAYVYGWVKENEGEIDAPIGKSRKDFRMYNAGRGARGKLRDSVTEYAVLNRFENAKGQFFSLVKFMPKTGRTHQIRVHAKYLNYPIVADTLYAGRNIKNGTLGFERQALHAKKITFTDLVGEIVSYEAPLPEDFEQVKRSEK